jgi:CBS domain containing-hemolysin-like protein
MNYHSLPIVTLLPNMGYFHAGKLPEVVHLSDPATDVMLDFKHTRACHVLTDALLVTANHEMTVGNVHALLVTNESERVQGVVGIEDILGEKPIKITQEKNVMYKDLKVTMVMTPINKIIGLRMNDIKHSKVGHIIQTLQEVKQFYALVVEDDIDSEEPYFRGLFSLAQISRQLDLDISVNELMTANLTQL